MKPVGDLLRLGRALPRAFRIGFRAVPHDSRHARTLPQPSRQTLGRAIGEQIDWPMGLQIDQQRAIAMPPSKGEVVDTQDPRRRGERRVRSVQEAQQRVRTGGHAGRHRQARPAFAPRRLGEAQE